MLTTDITNKAKALGDELQVVLQKHDIEHCFSMYWMGEFGKKENRGGSLNIINGDPGMIGVLFAKLFIQEPKFFELMKDVIRGMYLHPEAIKKQDAIKL